MYFAKRALRCKKAAEKKCLHAFSEAKASGAKGRAASENAPGNLLKTEKNTKFWCSLSFSGRREVSSAAPATVDRAERPVQTEQGDLRCERTDTYRRMIPYGF